MKKIVIIIKNIKTFYCFSLFNVVVFLNINVFLKWLVFSYFIKYFLHKSPNEYKSNKERYWTTKNQNQLGLIRLLEDQVKSVNLNFVLSKRFLLGPTHKKSSLISLHFDKQTVGIFKQIWVRNFSSMFEKNW